MVTETAGPGQMWDVVEEACERHAARAALVSADGREVSYTGLLEAATNVATNLTKILRGSERAQLGLHCRNRLETLMLYYGALRAGYVPFLMDQGYDELTVTKIAADCGLDAVIRVPEGGALADPDPGGWEWPELVKLSEPRDGPGRSVTTQTALCRFTTGSTGQPRALEFSAAAVRAAAEAWRLGTELTESDRVLCMAGIANGLAFNTSVLPALLAGSTVMFTESILSSRSVCRKLEDLGATRLVAFPRVYERLVASTLPESSGRALASLRVVVSAGAPLSLSVKERFASGWGVYVSDYYGLAECGPCTFEAGRAVNDGSLGACLPGVELRVEAGEPGETELLVRTRSMATRYLNSPGVLEGRMTDGFYRSGDYAAIKDGRLYLTGRSQRFVNQAGRKLDPTEIESCVTGLRGIAEAALVEVEEAGASVGALALVAPGGQIQRADVVKWLTQRIGPAKLPGRIVFVESLPRSSIGKIMTTRLREIISDASAADRRDRR